MRLDELTLADFVSREVHVAVAAERGAEQREQGLVS
jgi:hypothetical protein